MNFRWSNICVLQFLLVLHTNALKLVPAERTIVKTNGTTRTISKYYLLPQDEDSFDPSDSAPISDNESFTEFLREFREKKAAEQNPKKKVDKYKIYIKRKLKHKAPGNTTETTTEDLKSPITTDNSKLPATTTEGIKFRITSEKSKSPLTTTEDNKVPVATTEDNKLYVTTTDGNKSPDTTEATASPVPSDPLESKKIGTTETPITIYTTIITTIHNPKPSSTTFPTTTDEQFPEEISVQAPEEEDENDDRPKDLLQDPHEVLHIHHFDSNEFHPGNHSQGTRPKDEKVIKHVETEGFVGDLTKIVSDEDPDINSTAIDIEEPKNINTFNNEYQYPFGISKKNNTKQEEDDEFQKLLSSLKEPTENIPGYVTQESKPHNVHTPIQSDGLVFLDDSLETPFLNMPWQTNHSTPGFVHGHTHEATTVSSLKQQKETEFPIKLNEVWTLLSTGEHNKNHQHQANTIQVEHYENVHGHGNDHLHIAEISKNIPNALFYGNHTQLPSVDYSESPNIVEYTQSVTTDNPETKYPVKYTDTHNTQSDSYVDYTKSADTDISQSGANLGNGDNTQSESTDSSQTQLHTNPYYVDYNTQSANGDSYQSGSNSDYTGYAQSANNDYSQTGTDSVNTDYIQSVNIDITQIQSNPHYTADTHLGSIDSSQAGSNSNLTSKTQLANKDLIQMGTNTKNADYTNPANSDFSDYTGTQTANGNYSQTGSNSANTDYTQSANSDLSQIHSNSQYVDFTQSANMDYSQTGSNSDYTSYTQSESTDYSQSGTSSTYIDYTQSASSSFSQTPKYPFYSDYAQSQSKAFSQKETNSDYIGYMQSVSKDYSLGGTNDAYTDDTQSQLHPYYSELQSANADYLPPPRKPNHFYYSHSSLRPNYITSHKIFKDHKLGRGSHKNGWITYQEYTEEASPQIGIRPAHVHKEIDNRDTNNPSLAKIDNYIQLARVCPACFKRIYDDFQRKELTGQLGPNDVAMLQLFKKMILYSQNKQQQSSLMPHSDAFQDHPDIVDSQTQYQQDIPIYITPKSTPQNRPHNIDAKNKQTQAQEHQQITPNNHKIPVDAVEFLLEEGEVETVFDAHIPKPKIELFNEENVSKVIGAIETNRRTHRDKYTSNLYTLLKLLLDVGKALTGGDGMSWYRQLPSSTRNKIQRYLYHMMRQPWLQDLMFQLYKSNNNFNILKNPRWRTHLAAWRFPKELFNANIESYDKDEYDDDYSDNYQEATVDTQDVANTILAIVKSYIRSPHFTLSAGSTEYYQKQNEVLGQVATYLKQKGYPANFVEILISKLYSALNRHVRN